ncbi:MAG TPA: tetratricopeptide repeat protein [Micromonosporaceae bacterium]
MHLEPLRPAEAEQLLAGLLGHAAGIELDAISDIARLCAYLPLALRIAAARLTEQPERGIVWLRDELAGDDRLGALEMQGVSGIAVRAAFDLSYRRLAPETQRLFVLLGLIPGADFSVEGVAALADIPVSDARRELATLAGAHLIRARRDRRYDFHDLIREYAQTLAADFDERDAAYDRLYAWMCACVEAAAQRLYPSIARLPQWIPHGSTIEINLDLSDNDHATKWLDHELSGLIAAIRDGERNRHGDAVIHLASALRGHLIGHATLPEWLAIGEAALSAASHAGDLRAEAAAQINIAIAHASRDDYPRAIEHLESARFLSKRSGWLAGELTSSGNLGKIYWRIGEIASAHAAYRHVIQTSHTQGLPVVTATMIANIAELLVYMDRPVESLERTAEAIAIFDRFGGPINLADAYDNYAVAYQQVGDYERAEFYATKAVSIFQQTGDLTSEAVVLAHLSTITNDQGRRGDAWALANRAVAVARDVGQDRVEALTLNAAAALHIADADGESARRMASRACTLAVRVGARRVEIEALINLACAHRLLGEFETSAELAKRAYDIAEPLGFVGLARTAAALLDDPKPGSAQD